MTLLGLALILVVPACWAILLRWARCPGWPVVGGVVAGLLLGPTILGRTLPDAYVDLYAGAREPRAAVADLTLRQQQDRAAARQARWDAGRLADLDRDHRAALAEASRLRTEAEWESQRPLRVLTGVMVALMLAGAAAFAVRPSARGRGLSAALSVGAWAAAIPGGLAFGALRLFWDAGIGESALAAAAVAIGPWVLTPVDREAADQAELGGAAMIETAGRIATVLAVAAATVGLVAGGHLLLVLPLVAAAAGWLLPAGLGAAGPLLRPALQVVVVPAVAALAALRVDLVEDLSLWPAVVFLLLCGDGRWIGAVTGALVLGGRRGLRTMRLVLGSMAAGPTQLAVAAIATSATQMPGRWAAALLLGAVLIEVTTPARRGMARRLIRTEQEIEDLGGPEE